MRRALALAIALALVPAAAVAAPVSVRIASEVIVHGDEVVLSDIADVAGDGPVASRLRTLHVTPAPPAGATHTIPAELIRARLSADVTRVSLSGAPRVLVTRAFQTVRAADLVAAVRRAAGERLEAAATRGQPLTLVPIARPEDLRVPTGDLQVDARLHEGTAGAPTIAATVTIRVNGRDRHQLVLTFQIQRMVRVAIVARPLETRRTLAADDFRDELRPASEVPPDALPEVADPADLELLRPVQAGEIVTARMLRPRLAVKRGELVTLLLEGDGFRITTQGQASEDARRGDAVRVVNSASKREVLGFVEGGGVVRVPHRKLGGER